MVSNFDFTNEIRLEILNTNIVIQDLYIDVEINLSAEQTPNEAIVKIWNLSNATKNILKKDATGIRIKYREGAQQAFHTIIEGNKKNRIKTAKGNKNKTEKDASKKGTAKSVHFEESGADMATVIELGENFLNYTDVYFQKTYKKAISCKQIISQVAAKMGQGVKYIGAITDAKYLNGVAFSTSAKNVLNEVCNRMGCNWTFQQGVISVAKIIDKNPDFNEAQINLYNLDNANTPEFQDNDEVGIDTILSTKIFPNQWIKLEMNEIKGVFRVKKVNHKISNYSAENKTVLTVKEQAQQ